MGIFDASNRDQCEVNRLKTNTPLQALIMMNSELVIDSADWRDLPYTLGGSPIARMILGGREFRA